MIWCVVVWWVFLSFLFALKNSFFSQRFTLFLITALLFVIWWYTLSRTLFLLLLWLLVSKMFNNICILDLLFCTRIRFFSSFSFSRFVFWFVCIIIVVCLCFSPLYIITKWWWEIIKFDRTDLAWRWWSFLTFLECPRRVSSPRRKLCNFRASSSSPLPPPVSSRLPFLLWASVVAV